MSATSQPSSPGPVSEARNAAAMSLKIERMRATIPRLASCQSTRQAWFIRIEIKAQQLDEQLRKKRVQAASAMGRATAMPEPLPAAHYPTPEPGTSTPLSNSTGLGREGLPQHQSEHDWGTVLVWVVVWAVLGIPLWFLVAHSVGFLD